MKWRLSKRQGQESEDPPAPSGSRCRSGVTLDGLAGFRVPYTCFSRVSLRMPDTSCCAVTVLIVKPKESTANNTYFDVSFKLFFYR